MRNEKTTNLFNDLCVKFRDENGWTYEEMINDLRYYINREDDFEELLDEEDI